MILFDKPESFLWLALYYVSLVFVYLGFFVVTLVCCFLLANILAAPVYEMISVAIERDVNGGKVEEVGLWQSVVLIKEEIKKAFFVITISIVMLLIPGVNVIAIVVTAFLLGWDFYDYPLARRGWSFRQRLNFVAAHAWAVTAFGMWLTIPFAQFFLMPMAVAGGTQLSLEHLKNNKKL